MIPGQDPLDQCPGWTDEELRKELQIGIDQLDRGEGRPLDMAEIKTAINKRLSDLIAEGQAQAARGELLDGEEVFKALLARNAKRPRK